MEGNVMNWRSLMINRRLLLLFWLLVFPALGVQAQIRFVQISDPHMFDEEKEAADNKAVFATCVRRINDEVAKGADYKFIVITGDIGVENLVSRFIDKDGKRERRFEDNKETRDEKIRKGAAELASIMALSKVKLWLFVPGNNDLFNEEITTLNFYQQFLDELTKEVSSWGITVKDLCGNGEKLNQVGNSPSAPHLDGAYAFIGFNDASFKNNNDASRLVPGPRVSAIPMAGILTLNADQIRVQQQAYVQQVLHDVGNNGAFAFIFYHIPEVDDPYLTSGSSHQGLLDVLLTRHENSKYIGESNKYSAWFVASAIRDRWGEVVKDDKVRGLFAGHFHSKDRGVYQSYHWMRSSAYLSGSLSKLYICPPLAIKLQAGEKTPARGFQEVSIDKEGRLLSDDGQPGVRVFWYDPTTGSFSPSAIKKADEEAVRQIQLGALLERNGRLKEAESAYTKALEAESSEVHNSALISLNRVADKQVSPLNRYIFTPLEFSFSPEGMYLFFAICTLVMLAIIWPVLGYYLSDRNKAERYRLFRHLSAYLILILVSLLLLTFLIVTQKNFYVPASTSMSLTVVIILVCLYISWFLVRRVRRLTVKRGQGKLIIISLADTTNGKLASILPSVFAATREEIINSEQFEGTFSNGPTLPVVILAEETELAELVETTVSGRWGNIFGWLLRRTSQPAYSVRTALQSHGGTTTLIMCLEVLGSTTRIWSDTFSDSVLHSRQRDLAYQILIDILRRIKYGDTEDES
jgi:3',5'-cyclic AMP phosphodiesterase CpdA